jgi:hypothetical protein
MSLQPQVGLRELVFEFMALGFKPQSRLKQMIHIGWCTLAQCFAQINVQFRPKAHIDFAIGRKTDAVAMVAEILAHWRDKAQAQTQWIDAPITGRARAFMR